MKESIEYFCKNNGKFAKMNVKSIKKLKEFINYAEYENN